MVCNTHMTQLQAAHTAQILNSTSTRGLCDRQVSNSTPLVYFILLLNEPISIPLKPFERMSCHVMTCLVFSWIYQKMCRFLIHFLMKKQKIATTLRNLTNLRETIHKYRLCKHATGFTFTGTFSHHTRQLTRT